MSKKNIGYEPKTGSQETSKINKLISSEIQNENTPLQSPKKKLKNFDRDDFNDDEIVMDNVNCSTYKIQKQLEYFKTAS